MQEIKKDITLLAKVVRLKKSVVKTKIIPDIIAARLNNIFNNFHNSRIILKDLTRDNIIRTKDLTRDAIIRTKDLTKDSIIRTKDLTKDSIIRTKDLTKDSIIRTKDIADEVSQNYTSTSKIARKKYVYYLIFPFMFSIIFLKSVRIVLKNRKNPIDEQTDKEAVKEIDDIIANSDNVKNRISRFYERKSIVINPPIETKNFYFNKNKDYWLSVNRLTPEKRVYMQIMAFNNMPEERLIIVGGYDNCHISYVDYLKNIAKENIIFLELVAEKELIDLYANCRGFITTSKDEDFGMTVVEAMASGKPVIAPNEGGYKESVINGKTGILIDDIDEEKIVRAINLISKNLKSNPDKYKNSCQNQAEKFDSSVFIKKMKKVIERQ